MVGEDEDGDGEMATQVVFGVNSLSEPRIDFRLAYLVVANDESKY